MAEQALARPLLVAHLARRSRARPRRARGRSERRRRTRASAGRLAARRAWSLVELLLREPGPDAAGVDEAAVLPRGQVQGAEAGSRALGLRESDDGEVAGAVQPHLHPVGGARAAVGRVGLLADDAFEADLARRREEVFALVARRGRRSARARRGAEAAARSPLRVGERQPAQVVVPRRPGGRRRRASPAARRRRARCRAAPLEERALLEQAEARPRLRVEHDDLAVEHERRRRGGPDGARDLRETSPSSPCRAGSAGRPCRPRVPRAGGSRRT